MEDFDISIVWPEWEITDLLGEGPFGKVYLAKSESGGETKWGAVKLIIMPPDGYNELVAAGKREIINFARFQNDLTWEMTMFQAVEEGKFIKPDAMILKRHKNDTGWLCVSRMGLYTPCKQYLGKKPALRDVVRIGIEVCRATENYAMHGMIHGDICPDNIFVDDNGEILVGDFGIKRILAKSGAIIFDDEKSFFDSPEAEREEKYCFASDVYSIGMTMAYLLNGYMIPTGKNVGLIKCRSAKLMKVIKKSVAYNSEDRYKTAGEMLAALERTGIANVPFAPCSAVKMAEEKLKYNFAGNQEKADDTEKKIGFFRRLFSAFSKKNKENFGE